MTPAEQARIVKAAHDAAKDAPPLTADAVAMLQRDACPALRKSERGAA